MVSWATEFSPLHLFLKIPLAAQQHPVTGNQFQSHKAPRSLSARSTWTFPAQLCFPVDSAGLFCRSNQGTVKGAEHMWLASWHNC